MSQPAYSLAAKSQISASPRLQQAVRLLQMSALEFQLELQQQLVSNPFLEESEPGDSPNHSNIADEISTAGSNDNLPPASESSQAETTAFDHAVAGSSSDVEVSALEAADWNDLPSAGFETPARNASSGDSEFDVTEWATAGTSLREHLQQQVSGAQLSERERLVALLVIETLDDDGYLRDDVTETAEPLQLEEPPSDEEIARGIQIVQQFDPAGIAARDLSECLALQLQALDRDTPGRTLALKLVKGHLEQLARHDLGALQRRMDCSAPALQQAHGLIRRLDPRPGHRFTAPRTDYVVPDIIVVRQKDKLVAVINPAVMPRARLNTGCIDLLRSCGNGKHPAMQQQLQEARWLLRNAEQRHLTITRVAEAIIARQRAFFQYGEIALKPLILREVADELDLHESTLSRATSNKYMATPRGIFEFRHFFSRQLSTDTGGTCSATAVRALIREMIEAESRAAPLSDVCLAKMLTDSGICVARRTVAKYRNQMKVPPWELRYLP